MGVEKISPRMNDFTPQQLAAINGRGNLLVVAGAGTGKTRTLVSRCLRFVVNERESLENILMVTFTEAAAAEMRARIREELHRLQAANPGDERLAQQLALLDSARISTLHSFCLQLARQHFHELGLDPQFSVLDEQQTRPLARAALDELLEEHYAGAGDNDRAVQALVRSIGRGSDGRIRDLVWKLHNHSQALPDPERWLDDEQSRFERIEPDEWRGSFLEAVVAWRAESLDLVAERAAEATAARLCHEALRELPVNPDVSAAAKALRAVHNADDDKYWPYGTIGKVRDALRDFFDCAEFLGALLPDEAGNDPLAQDWQWVRGPMLALISLTREFTARFTAAKRELAGVDFADLEQGALRLLRDPAIAEEWRERLAQVFVDEYQDINAAQDAILTALSRSGETANRFMVGDVKQGIYRFRLANPKIFQNYKVAWEVAENRISDSDPSPGFATLSPAGGEGRERGQQTPGEFMERDGVREARINHGRALSLTENFRSREALLNFVNPLFAALMRPEVGGVAYEALEFGAPADRGALAAKPDDAPRVEFHLLARADDENGAEPQENEVDKKKVVLDLLAVEREARLVARRLRELKENGHEIWDKERKNFRSVKWSDMAVLLRSPSSRAEAFAMEFSKAGVPLVAGRDGFFESLEVSDLINLLRLLDNPLQDVPLAAVLRSPLVGLSLDELAQIRAHNDAKPFWTALARFHEGQNPEEQIALHGKVSEFLGQYHRWRELVRQTSLSQCLETALIETHYEALLQAGARGPERAANVRRLLDLARQFDPYQRQGLYRFLRFVEAQEEEELDLQPGPTPTEDAVRLISVHKSKGLEFPVVALACLGSRFNERDLNEPVLLNDRLGLCPKITPPDTDRSYPSLTHWMARRAERRELRGEELRLLYVAMTRARDSLILVGSANRKAAEIKWECAAPGWVNTGEVVRASSHLDWLLKWLPRATAQADWCDDRSGGNQLLQWRIHDESDDAFAGGVSPPPATPTAFRKGAGNDSALGEELKARLAWRYPFEAAMGEAAKTSVSALRRRAADEVDEEARKIFDARIGRATAKTRVTTDASQLSAADRGNAHHAFLQRLDLNRAGSEAELKSEARRFLASGRMSPAQVGALDFAAINQFWQSDLGRRIRANAGYVRRELAFTARFPTGELEGILHQNAGENRPSRESGVEHLKHEPGEGARGEERTSAPGTREDFVVVQGVADLVVLLPKEIWLLDFKTDEIVAGEVAAKTKLYEPQLKLYALALERIYRRTVTERRLHFLALSQAAGVATRGRYQQGELF